MILAALIRGGKTTPKTPLAKANLAEVAKVPCHAPVIETTLAGLATLALAAPAISPVEITRAGIVYTAPPRCYWCKSTDLWQSQYGATVCRVCHPASAGAELIPEKLSLATPQNLT